MKQSVLYDGKPMYSRELKPDAKALEKSAKALHQLRMMRTVDEARQGNDRLAVLDREFDDSLTGMSRSPQSAVVGIHLGEIGLFMSPVFRLCHQIFKSVL